MCIIVAKPSNRKVPKDRLELCFSHNPDGAGFMYSSGSDVKIEKGFFTFEEFWDSYKDHENDNVVMHFRIKTHGEINKDMCHPFRLNSGLAFAHNGIITNTAPKDHKAKQSDTFIFKKKFLSPMIKKYGLSILKDKHWKALIEDFIGYSKLAFLNAEGKIIIYNKQLGKDDGGVWYSNTSYEPRKPVNTNYTKGTLEQVATQKHFNNSHVPKSNYNTTQSNGSNLSLHDVVKITQEHNEVSWEFSKNDLAQVTAFGNVGTVWVKPIGVGGDSVPHVKIPVWKLEIISPETLDELIKMYTSLTDGIEDYDEYEDMNEIMMH